MKDEIAIPLERIASLLRNEQRRAGARHGLQPVQLDALRYLAQCNRYSDTPQGVAEYLGLTKGTVSQSLKVLEGKGLVEKRADVDDRRVVHLRLTAKGRKVLRDLAGASLVPEVEAGLGSRTRKGLADGLRQYLGTLQAANGSRTFGVCASCRYNRRLSDKAWRCELLEVDLKAGDVERICREHTPAGS